MSWISFLIAKGGYKKSPSSLMGKFLKNIAVFLKDTMGVLLLLWPSCYPVIPSLSLLNSSSKTEKGAGLKDWKISICYSLNRFYFPFCQGKR